MAELYNLRNDIKINKNKIQSNFDGLKNGSIPFAQLQHGDGGGAFSVRKSVAHNSTTNIVRISASNAPHGGFIIVTSRSIDTSESSVSTHYYMADYTDVTITELGINQRDADHTVTATCSTGIVTITVQTALYAGASEIVNVTVYAGGEGVLAFSAL